MSCSEYPTESASSAVPAGVAFHYDLPPELIAQDPPQRRGDSRLLHVAIGGEVRGEHAFRQLPDLLRAGDLLVLNDSRVLPARLWTRRAGSGGRVELLLVRPLSGDDDGWRALARPTRRLRPGSRLEVMDRDGTANVGAESPVMLEVTRLHGDGFCDVRARGEDLAAVAWRRGEMPLPPYIKRTADDPQRRQRLRNDRRRYQTVYARYDASGAGSGAAPTAGLHFGETLLDRLRTAGVGTTFLQLHVGPGTFRPPTDDQIRRRRLHREYFRLPAATWAAINETRQRGGRVFAVGTTSLRVLETVHRLRLSAADPADRHGRPAGQGAMRPAPREFAPTTEDPEPVFRGTAVRHGSDWEVAGQTRLFLRPPDAIDSVDGLVTNFHLPDSSLLMLVAALAGDTTWRAAYRYAVAHRLRFYSYGDAMLLDPCAGGYAPASGAGDGAGTER